MDVIVNLFMGSHDMSPITGDPYAQTIVNELMIQRVVRKLDQAGFDSIGIRGFNNIVQDVFDFMDEYDHRELENGGEVYSFKRGRARGGESSNGWLEIAGDRLYDWDRLAEVATMEEPCVLYRRGRAYADEPYIKMGRGNVVSGIDRYYNSPSGTYYAEAAYFPEAEWSNRREDRMDFLNDMDLNGYEIDRAYPVFKPHHLLQVNLDAVQEMKVGGIHIDEEAEIADSAEILGPCVISPSATVEPNAVVRGSLVGPGATIRAGAYVGHSVIGGNVEIGENVTFSDRSPTGNRINIDYESQTDSGASTFGSVVKSGVRIGAGTVITEGSVVDEPSVASGRTY